uniref:ERAP1-like C-terminal domain-containing protein n=1 Tax=Heterosigma akashiwo TaxID=2829 RepID=A0A7S3UYN2_HETAK
MGQLLSLYSEEEFFSSFQTKVRELFAQVWDRCGFCPKEGEEHRFGTLRSKLIGIMAATGNEDVIETAKLMFDRYAQDPVGSPIEADIRSTIFNVAMKNGDGQTFEKMVGVFRRATLGEEQRAALAALGRAGTDALRARAWRLTVDDGSPVRLQDIFWPMLALGASQKGAAFIWNRFKEEYTTLFAKYGGSNMVWPHVVGAAVAGPYTDEHADEVEAFFAQPGVQLTSAEKKYRQSLEGLRAKALQVARDREALIDMFANKTTAA